MKNKISKFLTLFLVVLSLGIAGFGIASVNNTNNGKVIYAATTSSSSYKTTDDYYFKTVDQGIAGLCWAYTACGTIESILAVNYGIDIDISESWLSVCLSINEGAIRQAYTSAGFGHIIGEANNPTIALYIMNNYGFFLEEDFPDISTFHSGNKQELYDFYANRENKLTLDKLGIKVLCSIQGENPASSRDQITKIKEQILLYGTLPAQIYYNSSAFTNINGKAVYNASGKKSPNHAVRLIGWDESFQGGCFIYRNSHGDSNEEFYIPYSKHNDNPGLTVQTITTPAYVTAYHKSPIFEKYVSYTTTSNSTAYKKGSPSGTQSYKNNKNVFYSNETVTVSFTSTEFNGSTPVVMRGSKDVSSLFSYSSSSTIHTITSKQPLSSGTYTVKLNTTDTETPILHTFIRVIDGLNFSNEAYNNSKLIYYAPLTYDTLSFKAGKFSLISEQPTFVCSENVTASIYKSSNLTPATANKYATGYVSFNILIKENKTLEAGENVKITFKTLNGNSITYTIFILTGQLNTSSVKAEAHYDLGNECNLSQELPQTLKFDSLTKETFLPKAKSLTKFISGWNIVNEDGTKTELTTRNNGYTILNFNQTTTKAGKNYYSNYNRTDTTDITYVKLEAIWSNFGYEININMPEGATLNDGNHIRVIDKNATGEAASYKFRLETKLGFEVSNVVVKYTNSANTNKVVTATSGEYVIENIKSDTTINISFNVKVTAPTSITFSTSNINKTYDGQDCTISATMEYNLDNDFIAHFVWKNGSTIVSEQELSKTKTASITVKNVSDSGNYTCSVYITLYGQNSDSVSTPAALEVKINKTPITIELLDLTLTYGDNLDLTNSSGKYKVTNGTLYSGDSLNLTLSSTYTKRTDADTTCTLTCSGASSDNYDITVARNTSNITVVKRRLVIKGKSYSSRRKQEIAKMTSKFYDIVEGSLVNGDTLPIKLEHNVTPESEVGKYELKLVFNEKSTYYDHIMKNYDIKLINGTYEMKPHIMTIVLLVLRICSYIMIGIIFIKIFKNLKKSKKKFNKSENLGYNYNGRK